jgi:YHS domain-containing protein
MKTITRDPVCGMDVDESSPVRVEHNGITYLFCSEKCRQKFLRDPGAFTDSQMENEEQSAEGAGAAGGEKVRQKGRGSKFTDYLPLVVIVTITLLVACAKQHASGGGSNWMGWMHDFMGFFLVVFSMFKFFNLDGFADGFQMYDLLAKPFRPYAYVYPFVELGLGLGYLAHWLPLAIYTATIVVMVFGSLGVIRALAKGLDIDCACMGTALKVPLSTVALVEDLGMAVMAGAMLLSVR